jgi:ribosomal protein L7/L12
VVVKLLKGSNRIYSCIEREAGASKLAVVKLVKELTGLGFERS